MTMYGIKQNVKGLLKGQTQLDKMLFNWIIAVHFKGKPATRPMVIENV